MKKSKYSIIFCFSLLLSLFFSWKLNASSKDNKLKEIQEFVRLKYCNFTSLEFEAVTQYKSKPDIINGREFSSENEWVVRTKAFISRQNYKYQSEKFQNLTTDKVIYAEEIGFDGTTYWKLIEKENSGMFLKNNLKGREKVNPELRTMLLDFTASSEGNTKTKLEDLMSVKARLEDKSEIIENEKTYKIVYDLPGNKVKISLWVSSQKDYLPVKYEVKSNEKIIESMIVKKISEMKTLNGEVFYYPSITETTLGSTKTIVKLQKFIPYANISDKEFSPNFKNGIYIYDEILGTNYTYSLNINELGIE